MLYKYYESRFNLLPSHIREALLKRWAEIVRSLACSQNDLHCLLPPDICKTGPGLFFLLLSSKLTKSDGSCLAYIICAPVVHGAILDKLVDAVRHMQVFKSCKASQTVISGIMLVRKGELLGSLSSAHREASAMVDLQGSFDLYSAEPKFTDGPIQTQRHTSGSYQVISGGGPSSSVYCTEDLPVFDSRNTIISCHDFSPGIHVWSTLVVHEPHDRFKCDLKHCFLVQWQLFAPEGQTLYVSMGGINTELTNSQGSPVQGVGDNAQWAPHFKKWTLPCFASRPYGD